MGYERMLYVSAACFMGAAVAVNDFKALPPGHSTGGYTWDEMTRLHQIEAYIKRCINSGAIPARRWPLFGIEPAPTAPVQGGLMQIEDAGLLVAIKDFREWVTRSEVQAPESWADALSDSIQWDGRPIPGTRVITGEPKGRPRELADDAQAEANEIACELYSLNNRMPTQKAIADKLATRHGMSWLSVKGRFKVRICKEYIKQQKQ